MPTFTFKRLLISPRVDFLKALAPIYGRISYPQSLTAYDDVEAFKEWEYEVPVGSWWVKWQSFNVEGEGPSVIRPLSHSKNGHGEYLGKFESGTFQPAPPSKPIPPTPVPPKASAIDPASILLGPEE
jgi:hypothetical protein